MELFRERMRSKSLTEKRHSVIGGRMRRDMDLFRESYMTPHEEMERCRSAYNTNGLISSSVDSLTDFFMGNNFDSVSDDKKSKTFMDGVINDINPDVFETAREGVENAVKTGNGYAEIEYNNEGMPIHFYSIPDSSMIYINSDAFGNPQKKSVYDPITNLSKTVWNTDEYYIQRVPDDFDDRTAGIQTKWYNLSYNFSSFKDIRIRGIPIPKQNMLHFKWGTGDAGLYGRSFIASVLDDHEILKRMEKAMGIIAKYKAVPKKIISPKEGEEFSNEEIDELTSYFEGLEDDENAVLNKPIEQSDLSYSGKDINFSGSIDHVRRKIISGLTPEFLIGYGMDTNRATAEQLLTAFMLRLETKRKIWERQWTESLVKPYQNKYNWIKDTKIKFGDIDFRTPMEKNNEVRAKWTSNQITYNEMRKGIGESFHKNGNIFYKDFLQQGLAEVNQDNEHLPINAKSLSPVPKVVQEMVGKRAKELREMMK